MRFASLNAQSDYFFNRGVVRIEDQNQLLFEPSNHNEAHRIPGMVKVYNAVATAVNETLKGDEFPIVLAADHASAGGTIAGIKQAYPEKRLGVVWIDAHADLHSPYTSPSGNIHGMPLATAIGEDNTESAVASPSEETIGFWNQLKGIGNITPKILPEDIIFMGVRSTEPPEDHLMAKYGIRNYTVDEVRRLGLEQTIKEAVERLSDCDLIYISFDVDSMDPSISVGTGTPVPHGFTEEEANGLLRGLLAEPKTKCLEIVEVNPVLDLKGNVMAEVAFRLLQSATSVINDR